MENKPMKILLIEDDEIECSKFREAVAKRDNIVLITSTNSASDGIKYVKKDKPDGIILDLELNKGQGSGFEFVQEIQKLKLSEYPKIIVTTNVCSNSVYDYLHANNVDFIFYKRQEAYSIENVLNTLLLLREFNTESKMKIPEYEGENNSEILSELIDRKLNAIGISNHLKGRKYFYDAILYILEDEQAESKIPIIPYLKSKYKKAPSSISRAMQNAILHAWNRSSIEDLEKNYTAKININTGVPTPMEFVYYYVDKIRKEM